MNNVVRIVVLVGMSIFGLRGILPALTTSQFLMLLLVLAGVAVAFCLAFTPGSCPLGELARRKGWLTTDHVSHIISCQKHCGGRFGEIALREKLLSERQLRELLHTQRSRAAA